MARRGITAVVWSKVCSRALYGVFLRLWRGMNLRTRESSLGDTVSPSPISPRRLSLPSTEHALVIFLPVHKPAELGPGAQ